MKIISFIKVTVPSETISIDESDSQVPFSASSQLFTRPKKRGVRVFDSLAIYYLFPLVQKNHDLIFIYSAEILDIYQ
jgi:hypothetical protein